MDKFRKHCVGGPAVVCSGFVAYWVCNAMHRVDGPARVAETPFWTEYDYRVNGVAHRIEGPAVADEGPHNAARTWYIEGRACNWRPWQRRARRLRWLAAHTFERNGDLTTPRGGSRAQQP